MKSLLIIIFLKRENKIRNKTLMWLIFLRKGMFAKTEFRYEDRVTYWKGTTKITPLSTKKVPTKQIKEMITIN